MTRLLYRALLQGSMLVSVIATLPAVATADMIDLAHPTLAPVLATNLGDFDRSVVFDVLTGFSITSAGIVFDPLLGGATAIAVDIYQSSYPANLGRVPLASASTGIVDAGLAFYDVPIAFTFAPSGRYDLAFRSLNLGGWGFDVNNMEFFDYNAGVPGGPYVVAGLVSLLDGGAGRPDFGAGYINRALPHARFNVVSPAPVPEPTSLLLLGTGGLGLIAKLRRRKRQQL